MSVNRFEDLRVWKLAKTFSDEIGGLIRDPAMQKDFAMCRQLSAASLSIVANIAEGFARGRGKEFVQKEFIQFIRIAASSNAEARSLLHAAFGRRCLGRAEYDRLVDIGRMLRVLEKRLKEPRAQSPSNY